MFSINLKKITFSTPVPEMIIIFVIKENVPFQNFLWGLTFGSSPKMYKGQTGRIF